MPNYWQLWTIGRCFGLWCESDSDRAVAAAVAVTLTVTVTVTNQPNTATQVLAAGFSDASDAPPNVSTACGRAGHGRHHSHHGGKRRGSRTAEAPAAAMTISSGGHVIGDIRVPSILIHGRVEGTVYSTENLEIAEGASIQGDLHYNVLQMHMGASVQGRLIHLVPEKAAQTAANEFAAKSSISE